MAEEVNDQEILRTRLFDGDLLEIPRPEEGIPGFLPDWFPGPLPALIYPPLAERGAEAGEQFDLQITPYHLYYGALRALAETATEEQAELLRRLVLEWNPHAPLELCELARLHVETDTETALLHYELALELDSNFYEATQDAGMCELALSAVQPEEQQERLDNAEEHFRRAIELRPEAGLSWWSLARVMHARGDAEGAQECLYQFLQGFPEGEQRDLVEIAIERGLDAEPDQQQAGVQATLHEAQALAFGDAPEQAVALMEPLVEAYPDTAEFWFVLGAAHRRAGNTAEAERCLRRTVRLAPAEPFAWWELARTSMDERQWRNAEGAIRKALELDPENALYHCDLARILLEQGDHEAAREAAEAARALVPDDPDVLEVLARVRGG